MNYLGTNTIETKRLILRQFKKTDYKDVFNNYANDQEVTKFLTRYPHKDLEASKEFIDNVASIYGNKTFRRAITDKVTNEVIGSIDIVRLNEEYSTGEIGYVMSKKYWNKGIMSEALKAVVDYLFLDVDLKVLIIRFDERNIGSRRVSEKAGFKVYNAEYRICKECEVNIVYSELKKSDYLLKI